MMTDPRVLARIGGVLYLIIIAIGVSEELFVRNRIVVPGDATATAANLRSMESLWRLSIAGEFVLLSCAVVLTLIFFVLLRPVSRELTLLAVFFNLVCIAVEAVAALNLSAALFPLGDAKYLTAFTPEQLNVLARMTIRGHGYGFGAALIFFGLECVVLGYLIFRSGFFPKALGVLMALAGAAYLTNSFALILSPAFADRIFPVLIVPFVAETSFAVWLLAKGVNVEKWRARTSTALPVYGSV